MDFLDQSMKRRHTARMRTLFLLQICIRIGGIGLLSVSAADSSTVMPDDPQYSGQWNLKIIGAPQTWAMTTGSTNVVVAVVDTGIDYNHPDLGGAIPVKPDSIPKAGIRHPTPLPSRSKLRSSMEWIKSLPSGVKRSPEAVSILPGRCRLSRIPIFLRSSLASSPFPIRHSPMIPSKCSSVGPWIDRASSPSSGLLPPCTAPSCG